MISLSSTQYCSVDIPLFLNEPYFIEDPGVACFFPKVNRFCEKKMTSYHSDTILYSTLKNV